MAKIIHEVEKCIGCGSCAAVCPKLFEMKDDGKSHLKDSKKDSANGNEILENENSNCAQEAADVCPVQCIHIIQ